VVLRNWSRTAPLVRDQAASGFTALESGLFHYARTWAELAIASTGVCQPAAEPPLLTIWKAASAHLCSGVVEIWRARKDGAKSSTSLA
jgi:hypothetical protein